MARFPFSFEGDRDAWRRFVEWLSTDPYSGSKRFGDEHRAIAQEDQRDRQGHADDQAAPPRGNVLVPLAAQGLGRASHELHRHCTRDAGAPSGLLAGTLARRYGVEALVAIPPSWPVRPLTERS